MFLLRFCIKWLEIPRGNKQNTCPVFVLAYSRLDEEGNSFWRQQWLMLSTFVQHTYPRYWPSWSIGPVIERRLQMRREKENNGLPNEPGKRKISHVYIMYFRMKVPFGKSGDNWAVILWLKNLLACRCNFLVNCCCLSRVINLEWTSRHVCYIFFLKISQTDF